MFSEELVVKFFYFFLEYRVKKFGKVVSARAERSGE